MSEEQNIEDGLNNVDDNGDKFIVDSTQLNEEPPTTYTLQPITPMEVHHHPQLHHKPKPWKEYLLEGLMIFLAVSMGFIAENIREHLSDQTKEREYIQSLMEDLKSDQQVLSQNISSLKSGVSMMDSLITILNESSPINKNTGELYYLARLAPRLYPLLNSKRTFEQLKNSGNFRLIRNLETSNKIMSYYEKFPLISLLESINENEFTEYKKTAAKIFEPTVFINMEGNNSQINRVSDNPPLRTTDKELLKELSMFAVYMHGTKKGVLGYEEEIKRNGLELINFLQKEYHLKNE